MAAEDAKTVPAAAAVPIIAQTDISVAEVSSTDAEIMSTVVAKKRAELAAAVRVVDDLAASLRNFYDQTTAEDIQARIRSAVSGCRAGQFQSPPTPTMQLNHLSPPHPLRRSADPDLYLDDAKPQPAALRELAAAIKYRDFTARALELAEDDGWHQVCHHTHQAVTPHHTTHHPCRRLMALTMTPSMAPDPPLRHAFHVQVMGLNASAVREQVRQEMAAHMAVFSRERDALRAENAAIVEQLHVLQTHVDLASIEGKESSNGGNVEGGGGGGGGGDGDGCGGGGGGGGGGGAGAVFVDETRAAHSDAEIEALHQRRFHELTATRDEVQRLQGEVQGSRHEAQVLREQLAKKDALLAGQACQIGEAVQTWVLRRDYKQQCYVGYRGEQGVNKISHMGFMAIRPKWVPVVKDDDPEVNEIYQRRANAAAVRSMCTFLGTIFDGELELLDTRPQNRYAREARAYVGKDMDLNGVDEHFCVGVPMAHNPFPVKSPRNAPPSQMDDSKYVFSCENNYDSQNSHDALIAFAALRDCEYHFPSDFLARLGSAGYAIQYIQEGQQFDSRKKHYCGCAHSGPVWHGSEVRVLPLT